jgi:hypothetical protein
MRLILTFIGDRGQVQLQLHVQIALALTLLTACALNLMFLLARL